MANVTTDNDDALGGIVPDIRLSEYDATPYLELSETALRSVRTEVNTGDVTRLEVQFNENGEVSLKATQYVGIVSLRDGPTIEIRPKAAGTHLLHLLRYAQGVSTTTVDREVSIEAGSTFVDALGYLFEAELSQLLDRGLHSEYRRVQRTESHLRGRLDLQQQLRRPHSSLDFECEYDELTIDTVVNRAILQATTILLRLARSPSLRRSLQRHRHVLRQQVSDAAVSPAELNRVELTRLNDHYADVLRLTNLIIRNQLIRELQTGSRKSFSLLVDMNRIFERVIERAMRTAVASRPGWTIDAQHSSRNLISGGKHTVMIRPDILVRNEAGTVQYVGDAKWKLGSPNNSDFYQLASYQLAYEAPGILLYPEQDGRVATKSIVADRYPLSLVEVPTQHPEEDLGYGAYISAIEAHVQAVLNGDPSRS